MLPDETQKPAISVIKDTLSEGVRVREDGDYVNGKRLLEESFTRSKDAQNDELIIKCGSELSIQYRLMAGRFAREDDVEQARKYSLMSLDLYKELEEKELLDPDHYFTQRNYSHALLYSGFIDQAVTELKRSIEVQPEDALKGDEMCHLASSYLDEEDMDLTQAMDLVEKGIHLIETNEGSPIALTYGIMTKASIFAKQDRIEKAAEELEKALKVAIEKDLGVRQEEIQYLQTQKPENMNILNVVSGSLRKERRHKRYRK